MNNLEVGSALDSIFDLLRRSNKYIDETTPWILAKDETQSDRLQTVLYNLLEAIRVSAVYLESFLPSTAKEIFRQLGIDKRQDIYANDNIYKTEKPQPLFNRIDIK